MSKPTSALTVTPTIPVRSKPAHPAHPAHTPKPLAAHKPQHSYTLMRHAVKPPHAKPALHAQAPTDVVKFTPAVLAAKPKLSSEQIDVARSQRAMAVPHSPSVARFNQPAQPARRSFATAGVPQGRPAASSVRPTANPQASIRAHARPASQTTPDIFEQAMANATSHQEPAPKESRRHKARRGARKRVRALSISAAVFAMLLLGGFVAYQNKVQLELQLASAKAGFPASMPGYHPAGYTARTLRYGSGNVTIGFSSGNQSYTVSQEKSDWDSETLLQNYVADTNQPYQAYQAAGRTVYIYGNGNATWVNGGVWFKVSGNANLATKQIIDLATSM